MKTIASQILVALLMTMLLVIGTAGYWDLQNTMRQRQEHLVLAQRQAAERLSYNVVSPLWNLNRAEVGKVIENEIAEEDIRAIVLYDEGGEVYAGMVREDTSGKAEPYDAGNTTQRQLLFRQQDATVKDVIYQNKTIGKVVLYANGERLQAVMSQERLFLAFKLLGLFGVLSFLLFFVLRKIVVQPLGELREWVSSMQPGTDLPPPKISPSDELDSLACAFARMTQRLNVSMAEISTLNTQLEHRVKERTEQLEKANQELSSARDVSEAATRAKSRFLANMSHEIRTPMNAILGYAQLMQRLPDLTGNVKQYTGVIAQSGDHLLALINDVLEMSKIEAGGVTLQEEDFSLTALLRDVDSMLGMRAAEKGLLLAVDVDPRLPTQLYADATKLRQVVVNIIGNAIKFTDNGSIRVRVALQSVDAKHLTIAIDIADTGPGIAKEEQSKVFESFEQTATGIRKGGTGLGMAISRQYARLMQGDLHFDSVLGQGTTVHFTFVAQPSQGVAHPLRSKADQYVTRLAPHSAQPKILIVDDVESNRDVLRLMLESVGFHTLRELDDGTGVHAMVQEWHPDIILMDRRMPGMDGLEATRAVRALPDAKRIRILMVTASAFKEDAKTSVDSGIDGFISKPFLYEEVFSELKRVFPTLAYLYGSDSSGSMPALFSNGDDWKDEREQMDAQLAAELMELVERGDILRFEKMVAEQLGTHFPALHQHLQGLANRFDYSSIRTVLQPSI